MKNILYSLAIAALVFSCKSQQVAAPAAPINPEDLATTITQDELREMLYVYASDEFEGRDTGSPGQKKAIEYLKKHYVDLGIPSPLGGDDYFQEVPLEKANAPEMSMSINGKSLEAVTSYVAVVSSADGDLSIEEIIDMGYGIDSEKYSDYNTDVNGKVIVIRSGEPKNDDGTYVITGSDAASKWSNMRQQFAAKRDIAKEKGARMVLFYYPEIYDMVAPRLGGGSGRLGIKGQSESMYMLLVNKDVVTALSGNAEADELPTNSGDIIKTSMNFSYKSSSKSVASENVIAYIKGSEKPDEYVIISAHLDHVGVEDGQIYNGADDDGSGSVAILEI
ncbi:MAG: M28 family peptidase, partial [Flavobacteriaceae bacterium]|nr:M28 family peptidase [Flavobacteriaceae bacterium]